MNPLTQATERLERTHGLDGVVERLDRATRPILGRPAVRAVLGGRWLGHAAHPLLTDLPIGFWTSATVLDVVGGSRSAPAAQTLIGLGVLSAVPAAATGWSDWTAQKKAVRRVGVVHAAGNAAAVGLFAASWFARRQGHRTTGIALGMVGGAVASGAGHLGGHMTVARGAGVRASQAALEDAETDPGHDAA